MPAISEWMTLYDCGAKSGSGARVQIHSITMYNVANIYELLYMPSSYIMRIILPAHSSPYVRGQHPHKIRIFTETPFNRSMIARVTVSSVRNEA